MDGDMRSQLEAIVERALDDPHLTKTPFPAAVAATTALLAQQTRALLLAFLVDEGDITPSGVTWGGVPMFGRYIVQREDER